MAKAPRVDLNDPLGDPLDEGFGAAPPPFPAGEADPFGQSPSDVSGHAVPPPSAVDPAMGAMALGGATGAAMPEPTVNPAEAAAVRKLALTLACLGVVATAGGIVALAWMRDVASGVPRVEFVVSSQAVGGGGFVGGEIDLPKPDEIGRGLVGGSVAWGGLAAIGRRTGDLENPALANLGKKAETKTIVESDEIPRGQRWRIFFDDGNTEISYTERLDFFGVELGLLGEGDEIEYCFNLKDKKPSVRKGPKSEEDRLYMSWSHGNYSEVDRDILLRAGLDPQGKVILHFIPEITENKLARIEQSYKGREPNQIRSTRFGVQPSAEGFSFYVLEQTPRD